MKIVQIYDRLSPRHKWNLIVHTMDAAHAQRCREVYIGKWQAFDKPTAARAQVGERTLEVETYQSADDSLPASVRLENVWSKDHEATI